MCMGKMPMQRDTGVPPVFGQASGLVPTLSPWGDSGPPAGGPGEGQPSVQTLGSNRNPVVRCFPALVSGQDPMPD